MLGRAIDKIVLSMTMAHRRGAEHGEDPPTARVGGARFGDEREVLRHVRSLIGDEGAAAYGRADGPTSLYRIVTGATGTDGPFTRQKRSLDPPERELCEHAMNAAPTTHPGAEPYRSICTVSTHTDPSDVNAGLMSPLKPHVIVLFGATGDLARRKLLPGLLHLFRAGLVPDCRIVGTSLDDLDDDGFRDVRPRRPATSSPAVGVERREWDAFARKLTLRRTSAGAAGLAAAVAEAEDELGGERRAAALPERPAEGRARRSWRCSARPGLAERSRIIMEKPFGTDLASARALNAFVHETFAEEQIFRIDHFLGKEAAQNILAFRFANGLFEPIWNRDHIDHVQIDVPETLGLGRRAGVLRDDRRLPRHGGHPPVPGPGVHGDGAADRAGTRAISEEKNKVFRSIRPIEPANVVRGQYHRLPRRARRRRRTPRPRRSSRCGARSTTGGGPACRSSCGPASGWPRARASSRSRSASRRRACSRPAPGSGAHGPDHLTFDLADASEAVAVVLRQAARARA